MTTHPVSKLLVQTVTPLPQAEVYFSLKKTLVVGAFGVLSGVAFYSYFQAKANDYRNWSHLDYDDKKLPTYRERELFVKSALSGLAAVALAAISFYCQSLIKNSTSASMGIRLIQQTSYSAVALIGIAVIVGTRIFTTFFKVHFTFYPPRISITRYPEPPEPPSSSQGRVQTSFSTPIRRHQPSRILQATSVRVRWIL